MNQRGNVTQVIYRPGQVWAYENRESEPLSTFTVLKVSTTEAGATIVHVTIDDIFMTDLNGKELATGISHAPFRCDALDRSVTELIRESDWIPEYKNDYAAWRRERGGIFACTVAEAIGVTEVALRHGSVASN